MAIDRACEDAMHTSLPGSPLLSSNVDSPLGSGDDLDGMGTRYGNTTDEKLDALLSNFVHFETQIAQILALTTWMSRMDSHITKTLGDFSTRLAEVEQNFSSFTARLCKVETYAASTSNVSGSARSWPALEQVDGSTAAGSHGPGSSDVNRNTRRRLDTSQALLMNMREVPSYYDSLVNSTSKGLQSGSLPFGKNPICWRVRNLSEFNCEAGFVSVRLVFETRGKCQDFVARYMDDGILFAITLPPET